MIAQPPPMPRFTIIVYRPDQEAKRKFYLSQAAAKRAADYYERCGFAVEHEYLHKLNKRFDHRQPK